MIRAEYTKQVLNFKCPAGTSRGVLKTRTIWFISVFEDFSPEIKGIGEIAPLPGLSIDDVPDFENKIQWVVAEINRGVSLELLELNEFPSIRFGLEMALLDLKNKGSKILFPSDFTNGKQFIPINGLIWMGGKSFMEGQIQEKLKKGFSCLKLKIGAINFEEEFAILKYIRKNYSADELQLRVDANGAFSPNEALEKLNRLATLNIHSIEQPIRQGQIKEMANLCQISSLPIALDEELIGVFSLAEKKQLLEQIKPQYIILKPTLLGGFAASDEWIKVANELKIGWWVTSALESNLGLSAIAQWTATLWNSMFQGLGTGELFTNNITCPLQLKGERLYYNPKLNWEINNI